MALITGSGLNHCSPRLYRRSIDWEIEHLVRRSVPHLHFVRSPGQQGLCAAAFDADRETSLSICGYCVLEGIGACPSGIALRSSRALGNVTGRCDIRAEAGIPVVRCGARHQQGHVVLTD